MQYTSLNTVGIIVISTMEDIKPSEEDSSQSSTKNTDDFVEYLLDTGNENQTTLYWNPIMEIDETGVRSVDILTNHVVGSYQVDVQLINENGQIGQSSKTFTVK